jgi:predicted RNase H-like HicB family nuclease
MRYAVVIENAGSNFSVYVPDLPGPIAIAGARAAQLSR